MTDQQSQQRINQAADQFTDALVQSYKTLAERGVSAQEGSAQVTEVFFNQTINNLRAHAEENRQTAKRLPEQHQRQAEAAQTITEESVGAYMDFIDSMFSYWQGGIQTAERAAEPAPAPSSSPPKTAESTATSQPSDAQLPLDNYDLLRANEVADRIEPLSLEEIKRLRDYEAKNQNRRSVLKRMDDRINAASEA